MNFVTLLGDRPARQIEFVLSPESVIQRHETRILHSSELPQDLNQAYAVLDRIQRNKKGDKNNAFKTGDLKKIAENLGLNATGDKETIANEIRGAVLSYFGES